MTSRESASHRFAPSMSVSSRSPTTSGRSAPIRCTVSSNSGRNGLPATTSGPWPTTACDRGDEGAVARCDPVGGRHRQVEVRGDPRQPRHHGIGALSQLAPAHVRMEALDHRERLRRRCQIRARGRARGARPRALTADDQDRGPGGTSRATSRAAAWAEVTTSAASASTPRSRRCSATASGVRAALLVTKASVMPPAAAHSAKQARGHRRPRDGRGRPRRPGRASRSRSGCSAAQLDDRSVAGDAVTCASLVPGSAVAVPCIVAEADATPRAMLRLRPFAAMRFNPVDGRRHRRGDLPTVRRDGPRDDRGPARLAPAQHRPADPAPPGARAARAPTTPMSQRASGSPGGAGRPPWSPTRSRASTSTSTATAEHQVCGLVGALELRKRDSGVILPHEGRDPSDRRGPAGDDGRGAGEPRADPAGVRRRPGRQRMRRPDPGDGTADRRGRQRRHFPPAVVDHRSAPCCSRSEQP